MLAEPSILEYTTETRHVIEGVMLWSKKEAIDGKTYTRKDITTIINKCYKYKGLCGAFYDTLEEAKNQPYLHGNYDGPNHYMKHAFKVISIWDPAEYSRKGKRNELRCAVEVFENEPDGERLLAYIDEGGALAFYPHLTEILGELCLVNLSLFAVKDKE